MDSNYFDYNGWIFRRMEDGSLTIETGTPASSTITKEKVFGEPASDVTRAISIPRDQVHSLLTYCLSGKVGNESVLTQVRSIEKQHLLVGTK